MQQLEKYTQYTNDSVFYRVSNENWQLFKQICFSIFFNNNTFKKHIKPRSYMSTIFKNQIVYRLE